MLECPSVEPREGRRFLGRPGQAEEPGEEGNPFDRIRDPRRGGPEGGPRLRGIGLVGDPEQPPEHGTREVIRELAAIRATSGLDPSDVGVAVRSQPHRRSQLAHEPRLPEPGFPDDRDDAAGARAQALADQHELLQLDVPPDHGAVLAHGSAASDARADGQDLERFDRLRPALERERPDPAPDHGPGDQAIGGAGHEHAHRRGRCLEAGGNVHGVADREVLLAPRAPDLADHDLAAVDPDADLQGNGCRQDRLHDRPSARPRRHGQGRRLGVQRPRAGD